MLRTLSDVALATVICTYIFTFLAIVSLAIQTFETINRWRKFELEDLLTWIAFIISLALIGQITWAVVDESQGQHMSNVTRSQLELIAKSLLVSEALWALVNTFIRVTASVFIHRIFVVETLPLTGVSIVHGIAALLTAVLICRPIQASWDDQDQGTCGNQTAAFISLEVIGLIIDIAILALPIWFIFSLHMQLKKKVSTIFIMSAGAL
ncbi:hypothetical protein F4818DRAFT_274425 [Hypoxylon cercidicola]|nr:hypothetical protein F4818DRAFT_274425 [Hypoxylon cercidicola]